MESKFGFVLFLELDKFYKQKVLIRNVLKIFKNVVRIPAVLYSKDFQKCLLVPFLLYLFHLCMYIIIQGHYMKEKVGLDLAPTIFFFQYKRIHGNKLGKH